MSKILTNDPRLSPFMRGRLDSLINTDFNSHFMLSALRAQEGMKRLSLAAHCAMMEGRELLMAAPRLHGKSTIRQQIARMQLEKVFFSTPANPFIIYDEYAEFERNRGITIDPTKETTRVAQAISEVINGGKEREKPLAYLKRYSSFVPTPKKVKSVDLQLLKEDRARHYG